MLQVCADLKEGPVGTWGVHLQDRKLPARPRVLLFLENLDKEDVLGMAKSFLPALLQVFYLIMSRLSGSPRTPQMRGPNVVCFREYAQ